MLSASPRDVHIGAARRHAVPFTYVYNHTQSHRMSCPTQEMLSAHGTCVKHWQCPQCTHTPCLVQDDEAALLDGSRDASAAARSAMEKSLAGPSAAHPTEGYGSQNLSLAKVGIQAFDMFQWVVIVSAISLHKGKSYLPP